MRTGGILRTKEGHTKAEATENTMASIQTNSIPWVHIYTGDYGVVLFFCTGPGNILRKIQFSCFIDITKTTGSLE